MGRLWWIGVLALLGAAALAADVTYEESFVSSFDRSDFMPALFDYPYGRGWSGFDRNEYVPMPFDPNRASTFRIYIKGNKLARIGTLSAVVYDLDRGAVIVIDREKRTFRVLTFAQMQEEINKGPRCGKNCRIVVEDTGRTANIDGVEASEYQISAVTGKGDDAEFAAHALYWTVPTLPSDALTNFVKTCTQKFGPRYSEVCALTRSNGFGPVGEAVPNLQGYVVARVIETRSRAAGIPLPRYDSSHAPWNVDTGPTPAQIRRTETRISNFLEGPVSDSVFEVPPGYRQTKKPPR